MACAPQNSEFTPAYYPSFPHDLPTVSLPTISLPLLLAHNTEEHACIFRACQSTGFFYLSLSGCSAGETILRNAERIVRVAEAVFRDLSLDEKQKYAQSSTLLGYKAKGASVADPRTGTRDTAEFFSVGKNDMLLGEQGKPMSRAWPRQIMEETCLFAEYIRAAHEIGIAVLDILAWKLGVDPGEFRGKHRMEGVSGDSVRIARGPARVREDQAEIQTPSHTDFGTITILMNWLGGLQVWSSSSRTASLGDSEPGVGEPGEWLWVEPKPGCAIINLGDAAVRFTDGKLCSVRHRVVPAPGRQGKYVRHSLAYFVRPEDECLMTPLMNQTSIGAGDSREIENEVLGKERGSQECLPAKEWIRRRAQGLGIHLGD